MTKYLRITGVICLIALLLLYSCSAPSKDIKKQPNILILFLDDLDPDFGCYGNTLTTTPNIDKLASEGMLFTRAYAAGTVCSPSHTNLFTGCYASTIGAPHHRSSYIDSLPDGYTILTQLMKEAGYFTVNFKSDGDRMYNKIYGATAKTDLNFNRGEPDNNLESGREVFENLQIIDPDSISSYFKGGVWEKKREEQPFFAYANIETGKKHGFEPGRVWALEKGISVKPEDIEVPPHYADNKEVRSVLASAQDAVSHTDYEVGKFLNALEMEGLADNTLVILLSDHGATLPRHKQCLWYTGIHVPLIIRWPGNVKKQTINEELASIIDIAPTCLKAAGASVPETMEGLNLLSKELKDRDHIFATRDGMNNFFDCSRSIISKQYQYIHHFFPEIPFLSNPYARRVLAFKSMKDQHAKDSLNALQDIYYAPEKMSFELYDLEKDPQETNNLAFHPDYTSLVSDYQLLLSRWQRQSGDEILDARKILNVDKVPPGTKVDSLLLYLEPTLP